LANVQLVEADVLISLPIAPTHVIFKGWAACFTGTVRLYWTGGLALAIIMARDRNAWVEVFKKKKIIKRLKKLNGLYYYL